MKIRRVCLLCIIVAVFIVSALSAQESSETRTLEELYLSTEIEILLLRSQAVSQHRDSKIEALEAIRLLHEDGRISANEDAILTILDSLAGEGLSRRVIADGRIANNFPEVRRRAVFLLGDIGGERAQDILYGVMNEESETMVLSESIHALRKTGVVDEKRASTYVSSILKRNTASPIPDSNLAIACIALIEELRISNADLLLEIVNVANGAYVDSVRKRALEVIYSFRDGGRS